MDFANEFYVRIYVRDTITWKRLGWDGTCVLMHVLRKLDFAGVLDLEQLEPWEAVVLHCGAPEDVARRGMEACLRLGCLIHNAHFLVAPNYRPANEAHKSDRLRARESRLRQALKGSTHDTTTTASRGATEPSRGVTNGHKPKRNRAQSDDSSPGAERSGAIPVPERSDSGSERSETGGDRAGAREDSPPGSSTPSEQAGRDRANGAHRDPAAASRAGARPAPSELLEALAEVWGSEVGSALSTAERGKLADLVREQLADAPDPIGTFTRAVRAFDESCIDRGKQPVFAWLATQWSEWSVAAAEPARTESPYERSERERRESEQAEQRKREQRAASRAARDAEPSMRPDALPGETKGAYYARQNAETAALVAAAKQAAPAPASEPPPQQSDVRPVPAAAAPLTPAQQQVRDAKAALKAARARGAPEAELEAFAAAVRVAERAAINAQRQAEGLPPIAEKSQ